MELVLINITQLVILDSPRGSNPYNSTKQYHQLILMINWFSILNFTKNFLRLVKMKKNFVDYTHVAHKSIKVFHI